MHRIHHISVTTGVLLSCFVLQITAVTSAEITVQKIFDDGTYNCFTDLTRFRDAYYCVFRSAISHGDPDSGVFGSIVVIRSKDLINWQEVARLKTDGADLRDPKLISLADEIRVYAVEGQKSPAEVLHYRATAWSSRDGQHWSEPQTMCPGYIFWRPRWNAGKFYVAAYLRRPGYCSVDILSSDDGYDWQLHSTAVPPAEFEHETLWANEADLLFLPDHEVLLFARRNFGGGTMNPANEHLGGFRRGLVTTADSRTMASWKTLNQENYFHAPATLLHRGKIYLAGRDMVELPNGGATETCRLWHFDPHKGFTEVAHFETRGDCSYPGIVAGSDTELIVSYYSCHEGETAYFEKPGKCDIYLVRVPISE